MKKILNIVTSLKGETSFSIRLSDAILEKLLVSYPGSQVTTRNLAKAPLPHLQEAHVGAFYTPPELRSAAQKMSIEKSDEAIKELMAADFVVIGVPLYNFGIPSTLKSWIDHIVRSGVTFDHKDGVIKGLVTSKKVYLSMAAGAIYSEGPMKDFDLTENYIRTTLGFIGMTDISTFRVEGTSVPGLKENAMPKALQSVNEFSY